MARYLDMCPQCGREFENYEDPVASREFCSVGCEADWIIGISPQQSRREREENNKPKERACERET